MTRADAARSRWSRRPSLVWRRHPPPAHCAPPATPHPADLAGCRSVARPEVPARPTTRTTGAPVTLRAFRPLGWTTGFSASSRLRRRSRSRAAHSSLRSPAAARAVRRVAGRPFARVSLPRRSPALDQEPSPMARARGSRAGRTARLRDGHRGCGTRVTRRRLRAQARRGTGAEPSDRQKLRRAESGSPPALVELFGGAEGMRHLVGGGRQRLGERLDLGHHVDARVPEYRRNGGDNHQCQERRRPAASRPRRRDDPFSSRRRHDRHRRDPSRARDASGRHEQGLERAFGRRSDAGAASMRASRASVHPRERERHLALAQPRGRRLDQRRMRSLCRKLAVVIGAELADQRLGTVAMFAGPA